MKIKKILNIKFYNNLKNKLRIGIYSHSIKNGGRARITSILVNYLYKVKIFKLYLFTRTDVEINEYHIPENIKRNKIKNNLIKIIFKTKIDILIYQLTNYFDIKILNKLNRPKIIFYQHSSIFYIIYSNYTLFLTLYKEYQDSKYIISLIPLENSYLFKKWNINSILMDNFISYEYNSIIPSDLTSKTVNDRKSK